MIMKNKRFRLTPVCTLLFSPMVLMVDTFFGEIPFSRAIATFFGGTCVADENTEIFSSDIGKQKELIEEDFKKVDEALLKTKLQDARSNCDVVEHKISRIKKSLTKKELEAFRQRIDKNRKMLPFKEDSLVAKAIELLHSKGVDASLHYAENDLRRFGVAEKKIIDVEEKILKEAPVIQQAFEREEVARVIKILESGELPDSSVTPYIIKSAQIMVKAKKDSIRRIEGAQKFKEMEKQEQTDRVRMQQTIKDRKPIAEETHRNEHEKQDAIVSAPEMSRKERDVVSRDTVEAHDSMKEHTTPDNNPATSKLVQINLQALKNHQREAQEKVMELYGFIENNQSREALDLFKLNRDFIAQYVDAQVFTILEQNIMQTVIDSQSKDSGNNLQAGEKRSDIDNGELSSEKEHFNRINGFLRDNKIEAAYVEFNRSEKQLKKVMEKSEFKQFKKMIENAYKTRNPGK
jgi:hypothetical protein